MCYERLLRQRHNIICMCKLNAVGDIEVGLSFSHWNDPHGMVSNVLFIDDIALFKQADMSAFVTEFNILGILLIPLSISET